MSVVRIILLQTYPNVIISFEIFVNKYVLYIIIGGLYMVNFICLNCYSDIAFIDHGAGWYECQCNNCNTNIAKFNSIIAGIAEM